MKKPLPTKKQATAKLPAKAQAGAKRSTRRNCVVCGSEVAPFSDENLCWVCRRLKVSAWGENTDSQMFAAE